MTSRSPRPPWVATALALALTLLALPACGPFRSDGGDDPSISPSEEGEILPGAYLYLVDEVEASFSYQGDGTGILRIVNRTGAELAAPSIYLLDARDGSRIDVTHPQAVPIPGDEPGNEARIPVTLSRAIEPRHIGLVALLIGTDDFGAFLRREQALAP